MQAIVQTGIEELDIQQRERPDPGPTEALVRVHAAGLCGSDVHSYLGDGGYESFPLPRILGHEYSGVVEDVGSAVSTVEPGDRVIEQPVHHCGTCLQCKNGQPNVCRDVSITGAHTDGAFTAYTSVDEAHLHAVPSGVSLRDAVTTEPTSVATRAVIDRSRATPGDRVLVEGPGPIGLLVALVADSLGAVVVVSGIDRDAEYRLPLLEGLGLETINVDAVDLDSETARRTDDAGFDVVFDTTGHHRGVEMAAGCVRRGGQVVIIGLPGEPSQLSFTPLVRGEIDIVSSYGSVWRNFEDALRLMEAGAIDPSTFVDEYTVAESSKAFTDFLNSRTCKPLFRFDDADD